MLDSKIGDLIMGLDKDKVDDLNHLQRLLGHKEPTGQVRLKIYRRGKGVSYLNVSLTELPEASALPVERDLF